VVGAIVEGNVDRSWDYRYEGAARRFLTPRTGSARFSTFSSSVQRETTEREIETLTETKTTLQAAVDTLRAAAAKV